MTTIDTGTETKKPTETVEERIARQEAALEKRLADLRGKKGEMIAEAALAEKREQLSQALIVSAREVIASMGITLTPAGITIHLKPNEAGEIDAEVLAGKRVGGTRGSGKRSANGIGRATITALDYAGFVLPDGTEVKSPAKVLDHFGHSHQAIGSGDAAHREILRFVRDNPDKAATVTVKIKDGSTISLKEAAEALGVTTTGK